MDIFACALYSELWMHNYSECLHTHEKLLLYFLQSCGTSECKPVGCQSQVIQGSAHQMVTVTFGALDVWTSSFQEIADDLVLLLESAGGKRWGKCRLALWGSPEITVITWLCANQNSDLQVSACKVCNQTPSKEILRDGCFCLILLHWAPGAQLYRVLVHLLRNICLLQPCGSSECKSCWLSELGSLGTHPLACSHKNWALGSSERN